MPQSTSVEPHAAAIDWACTKLQYGSVWLARSRLLKGSACCAEYPGTECPDAPRGFQLESIGCSAACADKSHGATKKADLTRCVLRDSDAHAVTSWQPKLCATKVIEVPGFWASTTSSRRVTQSPRNGLAQSCWSTRV